jgi:hypothetical protein
MSAEAEGATRSPYRLAVIHSVADFDRWAKVVGDGRSTVSGVVSMSVFRSIEDPNEVMLELELESVEAAKEVLVSASLRDLLDRAGIEIYPPVFLGERVDQLSGPPAGS